MQLLLVQHLWLAVKLSMPPHSDDPSATSSLIFFFLQHIPEAIKEFTSADAMLKDVRCVAEKVACLHTPLTDKSTLKYELSLIILTSRRVSHRSRQKAGLPIPGVTFSAGQGSKAHVR